MSRTYYEMEITYANKKIDRLLLPAATNVDALDEADKKVKEKLKIRILRIISPEDGHEEA